MANKFKRIWPNHIYKKVSHNSLFYIEKKEGVTKKSQFCHRYS